jgi:DNA polymerase
MKVYISNRKETREDLDKIHHHIFNHKADDEKIKLFSELCESAYEFSPSERCKNKTCVIGPACGNLDSKIMFIAEAPGRNGAQRTGIPIYGDPAGDNFERILLQSTNNMIGREDVYSH